MIFKKNLHTHIFSNKQSFWDIDKSKFYEIANGRKYQIEKNNTDIIISRKFYDIFDMVGFLPLRMVAFAKATVSEENKKIHLNLIVSVKQIIEIPFGAMILFVYSIIIYHMQIRLNSIIFVIVISIIFFLYYRLIKYGKNKFDEELRVDIAYFK